MAPALARPLPRSLLVAAGSALAGGLAALALLALVHTGPAREDASFSITVPHGWKLSRGPAAAVLRRGDGRATVIVRRTGELHGSLRTVARDLTARLASRLPGFRLVGARVGRVRAGAAFVYTFARRGAAQSLTVVKLGGATYRIDTVVRAGSPAAATQAAAAVASFGR
jgi:predicted Zn-dependent protease